MYRNADITLLDDPFSALDAQVGAEVFRKSLLNHFKSKTVILVTHQLHFLPQFDHIVVMENGKISEQGTYSDLIASGGALNLLMQNYSLEEEGVKEKTKVPGDAENIKNNDSKGGIIVAEDRLIVFFILN
jgi:ATP-binding cassette subfamily C (CFTR/MRP) protein 1